MAYIGFIFSYYFIAVIIITVLLGIVFTVLVVPAKYGSKPGRVFRVAFQKKTGAVPPKDVEPIIFTTKKWYFGIVVYLLMVAAFIPLYITTVPTGLFYTDRLIMVSVLAVILLIAGVVVLLVHHYFAVLFIFPDRVILKSVFKTKAYYYKDLDCLRLGFTYTRHARYDAYEFWQNDKKVMALSILVFNNISFLEQVFTKDNPCVATVIDDRLN